MIGIVGCGLWGSLAARRFLELGVLSLACDALPQRAAALGVRTVATAGEAMRDAGIRAVVVATPTKTHEALAREALLAGKHVFVAPPLVLDQGQARELFKLARARDLLLAIGLPSLHAPAVSSLLALVRNGVLGRVVSVDCQSLDQPGARREDNDAWRFSVDAFSLLLRLAGEEPETACCVGGPGLTSTLLTFPSGLTAHSLVSWRHPFPVRQIAVMGEKATAVLDESRPLQDVLRVHPAGADRSESARTPLGDPLGLACAAFLDRLRAGVAPQVEDDHWLGVHRTLDAARRSLGRQAPERLAADPDGAFVHPTAVVDQGTRLGQGVRIWHFCHILADCVIGERTNIGQNVMVGPGVTIGAGCKIQNNVSVYPGVSLEDGVFCGPSMVFTNVHVPRAAIPRMDQARATPVRVGATLGANCTIVCGNEIGAYAFVGAGAVVTKPVPPHALVVGNPARRVGWVCRCGFRLDRDLTCTACDARYEREGEGLRLVPDSGASPQTT